MISYRERELLMVQKFLADETHFMANSFASSCEKMSQNQPINILSHSYPELSSYSELVNYVKSQGYDTFMRFTDLLNPEEIEQLSREREEIDNKFAEITKLDTRDIGFVITAAGLHVIRQIFQPKMNLDGLMGDRLDDKSAKNKVDKTETKDKIKKEQSKDSFEEKNSKKYYYASTTEIANLNHVPYDIIKGSAKFNLGLNGKNHRYKTLGHDPKLGLVFGTCNILTNTLTTNQFASFHIRNSEISEHADTIKMFQYSIKRFEESKPAVAIALAKQVYHIETDEQSKAGIPLPFLQLILDDKTIAELCKKHIDYDLLNVVKAVGQQAALSELINFIIATMHRILMAKEIYDEQEKQGATIDAIKDYHIFSGKNMTIQEVRTRKILIISNSIATLLNVIVVGAMTGVKLAAHDPNFYKELEKLDAGGLLVTLRHIISDGMMITKIKKMFIEQCQEEKFQKELKQIENEIETLSMKN